MNKKLMNNAFSIGPFFILLAGQGQGAPIIDRGVATEKEGPLRIGDCFVIRPPFTKHRPVTALFLGRWRRQNGDGFTNVAADAQSQPFPYAAPLTDENCSESLSAMLMECAERLGNFPEAKIDPRIWGRLLVYAPMAITDEQILEAAKQTLYPIRPCDENVLALVRRLKVLRSGS